LELEEEALSIRRQIEHFLVAYADKGVGRLKVKEIHYGSPGFVDLVGFAVTTHTTAKEAR
jgi:hypothetical protein